MTKRIEAALAVASLLAVCSFAPSARAADDAGNPDDFGTHGGQFIISADRFIPFFAYTRSHSEQTLNGTTTSTTTTGTGLGLLWGFHEANPTVYNVPRVGFDLTVIPSLTLGTDVFGYVTLGGSNDVTKSQNGQSNTQSQPASNWRVFGIAPRIGWIFRLGDLFSFWARGGVSYYTENDKETQTSDTGVETVTNITVNQFAFDLDPQLVFTPVQHFGITLGAAADLPLTGSTTRDQTTAGKITNLSLDSSFMHLGFQLGLLGWL
jgi:hypothetical protein